MSLSSRIQQKVNAIHINEQSLADNKKRDIDARVNAMTPMFNTLKSELSEFGLTVTMHTDPNHLPCPAIHIKGMRPMGVAYNKISEIYLDSSESIRQWHAGSCNRHIHTLDSDQALLDHVVDAVSQEIK